jgi:predicted TIM-barrel fold metal-dependent hydrolase
MHTPWGDMRVADAHVHFFSHGFLSGLARQKGAEAPDLGAALGWEIPAPEPEALAERWISELDRHGVNRSVLIASAHGDEHSVAAAVRRHPQRFVGYFMLDPTAPDAMDRTRSAIESQGLRGVCLFPAMHRYSIHDERVRPVLELAQSRPDTVVFVHCGVLTVGVRKRLGLPSRFDMRFSNPIDLHAVALHYPEVSFVVPHFGGGYFREALMLADLCPNVYLDTSSSNSWMRYQERGCDLETVFRRALEVAGPKRLLFGTDSSFFPRGWQREIYDRQTAALHSIGVRAEDAAQILGGNLEGLLGR